MDKMKITIDLSQDIHVLNLNHLLNVLLDKKEKLMIDYQNEFEVTKKFNDIKKTLGI